jgi:hypothetical protein
VLSKNGSVSPAWAREMSRPRDECWGRRWTETRVRCNCVDVQAAIGCGGVVMRQASRLGKRGAGPKRVELTGRQTEKGVTSESEWDNNGYCTTSREVGCGPRASPCLSVSCVFPSWERLLAGVGGNGERGGQESRERAWSTVSHSETWGM